MATQTTKQTQCPGCGAKGKRVGTSTMRGLLNDGLGESIRADQIDPCASASEDDTGCKAVSGDTGWRFCDSTDCDTVYFSEDEFKAFTTSQLRVAVGVKEASGERPLCYCFGHSIASIKDELRTQGRSDALENIRANMDDPGCHCETLNPSGSCCLGSVTKGIQIARKELGMSESNVMPATPAKSSSNRAEKIAKIGTVFSAIMASACCWLPLLLLAVGVSGAGVAATLEAYRPLFILLTFGCLGAAFFFTYRPKTATAKAGQGCCDSEPVEEGDCCPPTSNRRFNMIAVNKVMLWVVTVLAVAFLFFPSYVGALFGTGDDNAVTKDMNQVVIQIEGMTCEGCATTVAQAIRQVPGVLAVEVNYERKQAVVGTETGRPVPREEILEAIDKAGYSARSVEANQSDRAEPDSEQTELIDLSDDAVELRQAFNAEKSEVRVVLLVSPG